MPRKKHYIYLLLLLILSNWGCALGTTDAENPPAGEPLFVNAAGAISSKICDRLWLCGAELDPFYCSEDILLEFFNGAVLGLSSGAYTFDYLQKKEALRVLISNEANTIECLEELHSLSCDNTALYNAYLPSDDTYVLSPLLAQIPSCQTIYDNPEIISGLNPEPPFPESNTDPFSYYE